MELTENFMANNYLQIGDALLYPHGIERFRTSNLPAYLYEVLIREKQNMSDIQAYIRQTIYTLMCQRLRNFSRYSDISAADKIKKNCII